MEPIVKLSDLDSKEGLYALKFWATWCGPCKLMNPHVQKLESEFPEIQWLSVDADEVPDLVANFNVKSLPTLVFLKDKVEVSRVEGVSMINPLRKICRDLIG